MNIWNWLNAIFGPQGAPIVLLLAGVLVFVYVLIGPTLWRDWQERKRLKHKLDDLLKAFRENSPQESKSDTAPRMQRTQSEDSKPEALATDINSEADILDQFREIFKRVIDDRGVTYSEEALRYLVLEYYINAKRKPRAVHPRDLIDELVDIARYREGLSYSYSLPMLGELVRVVEQRIRDLATTREEQSEGLDSRQAHEQRKNT